MKSYTDLEQSKKLAEILPPKTADMRYSPLGRTHPWVLENDLFEKDAILCWSLTALLNVVNIGNFVTLYYEYNAWHLKVDISGNASDNRISYCVIYADNQIDACVEMIFKLHNFGII